MAIYEISGIKERTDYSFALKTVYEEVNNTKIKLSYNNKNGVLTFSIEEEINPFELNLKLAGKGLELKVLEE